ncbi:hypothetical protein E4K10_20905 [Streptomyces sp. T1317-0309]|nr:hypothetical protein E4K10_20905 [Streptomyces sp. T1317-0309]
MTQPSGVSPIDPHGTRRKGRRAKHWAANRTADPQAASRGPAPDASARPPPARCPRRDPSPAPRAGREDHGRRRERNRPPPPPLVPAWSSSSTRHGPRCRPPSLRGRCTRHRACPRPRPAPRGDRLVVTVRHAGQADGTYVLRCHPDLGSHPDPVRACRTLDKRTVWGRGPFAPVPPRSLCTMQYGGPATAHVTGVWAGRPVDARYSRGDGCQMSRWDDLVPLLPDVRSQNPPRRILAGPGRRHG